MHSFWDKNLIRKWINPDLRYNSIEIEESEIISSNNLIYWMFGWIDRSSIEDPVRCVLNNRTKDKLITIIKNYVKTNDDAGHLDSYKNVGDIIMEDDFTIRTRIFSDSFNPYQVSDFNNIRYLINQKSEP